MSNIKVLTTENLQVFKEHFVDLSDSIAQKQDALTMATDIDVDYMFMKPYEIGFTGMTGSQTTLTRTGEAVGATWSASSGVISFSGININRIFGGYYGSNGEYLTWDSINWKYKHNGEIYSGDVGVRINKFFAKPIYSQGYLDGFSLYFGKYAPDSSYQDWFLGKDHIWVGCYKTRGSGMTDGLQSKPGLSFISSVSANDIISAYKKNTSSVYHLHEKWYNEDTIMKVLFMALFATKNSKSVYPAATYRHYSADTRATGYMDRYRAQSLFAFESGAMLGHGGNMFLGIEDFIGWGYELVAGIISDKSGNVYASSDFENFSYSETYPASSCSLPVSGLIVSLQLDNTNIGLLIPEETMVTDSFISYFCNAFNGYGYTANNAYSLFQGAYGPRNDSGKETMGLFFCTASVSSTVSQSVHSARLCGLPL